MMPLTLKATRGLPRSGKSVYAQGWVAEDPENRVRVSSDDLTFMLTDAKFILDTTAPVVIASRDVLIRRCLTDGFSVIVDDTNH